MLVFKSEFELVSTRSTLNGEVVILKEDACIIEAVISECQLTYPKRPIITFLEKEDWPKLEEAGVDDNW
jgi:hypothetical protein